MVRLDVDLDPRALGKRLPEALERRDEPEVVERRRPQLDREPPDVLQRVDDLRPQRLRPLRAPPRGWPRPRPASGRAGSTSGPGRSRRAARGRGARARAPGSRPPGEASRARRGRRGRPRPTRARRTSRRGGARPRVKRGSAAATVVRGDHADRPVADEHRYVAAPSEDPFAGRDPGRPRRRRASSRPARCAAAPSRGPLFDREPPRKVPRSSSARGPAAASILRSPVPVGSAITTTSASIKLAQPRGDQVEKGAELGLARERVPDLGQRLELVRASAWRTRRAARSRSRRRPAPRAS